MSKMADDPATKPIEQAKSIEQKGGERSDDSTPKLAGPSQSMEEKKEKRSGDSTAKLAGLSMMSKLRYQELDLQRQRSLSESMEEKGRKRFADVTAKLAGLSMISELRDQELDLQRQRSLPGFIWEKGRKDSDDLPTTWAGQFKTTQLKRVLLYTRRLIVTDNPTDMQRSTVVKSVQDTVLTGDAELKLYVNKWMSTEDEALLELRLFDSYQYLISILAPLCPAVEQLSIVFYGMRLQQLIHKPLPMRSVITVCIKSLYCSRTLCETLLSVSKYFPNAESVDLQLLNLHLYNKANIPELNSSLSMRELKLRYKGSLLDGEATERVFLDISTSCPNIVSLVLSGFEQYLLSKSGKDIKSYKLPNLTNIHLEPFGTNGCCRFETLTSVLHVVTSPRLKLVGAKKVQLGGAEFTYVKWSRTSSGDELELEGASSAVTMADLMHLVSNELKGVTVLTFDKCKVDFPQSISNPPQSTGEKSSLRELKFLNVECPPSQTDIQKLSEMYPNVEVTVEHESQASSEDSKQGTGMPFSPERKMSQSSSPSPIHSIDGLILAKARVQVRKEQKYTENNEEEGQEEEEGKGGDEEEEEEYCMAIENLLYETDEVNVKPIKMECCKRVGVKGGKIQLDSFGIELEIPPGAIDSEPPQDIYLRVLTDTPNLGNNKEEMSVCFGVQCLAPDDLVLKLPVTYTIPHCAVITRYSNVEAVLYMGEGEYSPDAEVKEQVPLTQSGIPNCNIDRDILRLRMNHFSWALIRFKLKNFSFRGKRMCCLPFAEKRLPEERTPVVLRAHLYDDIKGSKERVSQEEDIVGFARVHPEAEVLINEAEVDVTMTCFLDRDLIGDATVKYDELWRGQSRMKSFVLDLRSKLDERIIVTLQVGQTGESVEELRCIFKFTTPRRSTGLPTHDLEQLQGASSSQTLQSSHRSKGGILDNISGKQEDFDEKLKVVAQRVVKHEEIDNLGKDLGFKPEDIQRYINTNMKNAEVSCWGTLSMLRDWRKKQTKATVRETLKDVLEKAGQIHLADELFDELVRATSRVQALKEGTDSQNTDEEEKMEEEDEEEDEYFMAMESLLNETGTFQVDRSTVARELGRRDEIDDSGRV